MVVHLQNVMRDSNGTKRFFSGNIATKLVKRDLSSFNEIVNETVAFIVRHILC